MKTILMLAIKQKTIDRCSSLLLLLTLFSGIYAQQPEVDDTRRHDFLFWNVENFFDTEDEPGKRDDEFTPTGSRHWTQKRYYRKLYNMFKVIILAGRDRPVTLIGLCEIENEKVLRDLVFNTPLAMDNLGYIHREGPDRRGIDVALLYRKDVFTVLDRNWVCVENPGDSTFITREILHVIGILDEQDTMHIFINHWPSRYGGYTETISLRMLASRTLEQEINRVFLANKNANILVMGDFNDEPWDASLRYLIDSQGGKLFNLMDEMSQKGTVKFRGQWTLFDQAIAGGPLFGCSMAGCQHVRALILDVGLLLTPDRAYTGQKPWRTYTGYRYEGGFSDHLPIIVTLGLDR